MCNKEKFWGKLACAVGRPEWEHDPRFATFAARLEHRDLITEMLDEVLSRARHRNLARAVRGGGARRPR